MRVHLIIIWVALALSGCLGQEKDMSTSPEALTTLPRLCGKEGYRYLYQGYIRPHCGGCHQTGGLGPSAFADPDFDTAYTLALTEASDVFLSFVENNRFCIECDRPPGSPMYEQIRQWLESRGQACDNP